MYRSKGSTNGFRYSESLIGRKGAAIAVVPLRSGLSYAVKPRAAKQTARKHGAIGFWRVKHGA